MKTTMNVARGLLLCAAVALSQPVLAQAPGGLKEKLLAAKQAAAQSQQALRSYTWIEKTELSYKGEVKNTKINSCRYGTDGKVQKTVIQEPPPADKKPGLRGKIIEKKKGEMQEELQAAMALVHQYVPPDPGLIQVVIGAGQASLSQQGPELVALTFPNYLKAGDALTLTLDSAFKAMRRIGVTTYMDDPAKPVTLAVQMASLPDASYPASVTLGIPASSIEVRVTNSNYQRVAP